jgi:hypothetical protein
MTQVGWTCPTCDKSMASEGGFKIHLSLHHSGTPVGRNEPVTDVPKLSEPLLDPSLLASLSTLDTPLLNRRKRSPRAAGGVWDVKIAAEGAGESINPAVADAFLSALREEGARVSTSFHPNKTCHYLVELTVRADGVLTAVLRGIGHFQAAAQAAGLPAVTVVGIDAREPTGTADRDGSA